MLSPGKADPQAEADLYLQRAGARTGRSGGGPVRQALAVAGMSFGCVLDGTVIAYSSPALPSLFKPDSSIQIDIHWASWIGNLYQFQNVIKFWRKVYNCKFSSVLMYHFPSFRHSYKKICIALSNYFQIYNF
jgi:hypothetical protein